MPSRQSRKGLRLRLTPALQSVLHALVFLSAAAAWGQGPTAPPDDPQVTMFPHSEGARYWLSGQANVIFQGRLPFHSPYEGPNSFRNSAEYKTSLVETLFTALR